MTTLNCLKKPMTTLGDDVIFDEILPRLPPNSLMRFKCVSKSYNSVISSRNFAKLYLRYNPSGLLILPGNDQIRCYDLDSTTATETFTWNDGGPISVLGSANGVICIYTPNATNQLLLLNPITRICRGIPIPYFRLEYPLSLGYPFVQGGAGRYIGFAFDHQNNDFRIVGVSDGKPSDFIKTRVTKVYSLNYNSWMKIETQTHEDSMQGIYPGGTLVNNHLLHWMFWNYSLRKRRICTFDVCKNKWVDDVLLPHYYYDPSQTSLVLVDIGVLDDRLISSFETVGNCYDVWVMKEYGVQDSWVKLLSIPDSKGTHGGLAPLACRGLTGDILIRQRIRTWLFWYNRMDGGMTDAKFDDAPDFTKLQVFMCAKSLIDIPGGKLFEGSSEN